MVNSVGVISKQVTHGDDLVVLPRKEYERMTRYVRELKDALLKISRGEKELRLGKTRKVFSLRELL